MALDLGELFARVTVDTTTADRNLSAFERRLLQAARTNVPDIPVEVDTATADRRLQALEGDLVGLPDGEVMVDADTATAERGLAKVAGEVEALPAGQVFVDAVVSGALGELGKIASEVRGLPDGEVTVRAKADGFDDLKADAAAGGADAGDAAGEGLSAGIIAAIATIPVAGAVVGIGAALGKSLMDGLQVEVRSDRLLATTGLDEATVARLGQAAGESYANNFGDTIEENFETARVALQSGLLDPASTARDSQQVIEQLAGVADILGEDIPRVARATAVILRNGLAVDAAGAFDILVRGAQLGANEAEDLLDTFTEYPALFERLGLDGADALGLLSQGLQAGARDTDFVADALKEFQIRATDGSTASAEAFEILGMNAETATAKIAAGGESAREGLDEVLDGLRAIEDPVKRNEAAVGLFGTKAEDLGDALFALDLDKVATDLGTVEGAASGAITALYDNQAGQLDTAMRNITIAADGIKGALAEAFGPQIADFADTITGNREAVVDFLLDMANGAFDAGRAFVEAAAVGIEGFGDLAASTQPVLEALAGVIEAGALVARLGGNFGLSDDLKEAADGIRTAGDRLVELDGQSEEAADALRENLITNGLDPAQARLNEVGIDIATQARFTDSTKRLAGAVADIGYAADGSQLAIERAGASFDTTTEAGRLLDEQIRTAAAALDEQTEAGREAGRTVEELSADYSANRDELIKQIEAMGFTREEAVALADSYGAVPRDVTTDFATPGSVEAVVQAALVKAGLNEVPNAKEIFVRLTAPGFDGALARIRSGMASLQSDYGDVMLRARATGANVAVATGGYVTGPGTGTSDSIPAMLSNGEFVVRAAAVDALGVGFLQELNRNAEVPAFAGGGYVLSVGQSATTPAMPTASAQAPTAPGRSVTHNYHLHQVLTPPAAADAINLRQRIAEAEALL